MSTTRSQPSEWDWLEQKNFIGYEYLIKDTSLKDLVVLLRAQGLHTTKGQLEYKLRTWNISKNLDKKTWQYVERKISQRKQKGKGSDVIHCGRRLQKLKITKETNRHRETNITARFKTPPPSPVNPQLSICTPPSFQMSFEWPSSLPWLRLRETSWNITINASSSNVLTVHQRDQASIALSLMMGVLVPQSRQNLSISLSKLIIGVSNVMPEWYPGEHTKTAQNLFAGPTTESLSEYFKVMVYMVSNSMVTQHHSQLDFYTSLIGIIDLRADLKKLRNESSTFRAFFENLFQFEIRQATSRFKYNTERPRPLHLITWLLELGHDPNCHCQVVLYNSLVLATPIQQATIAGNLELVELLLRFHACADIPQSRTHKEAFVNLALESGCSDVTKLRVLNLLFDHKFLNMDEMLRAAIELRDEALMCKMLQCGADATSYETSWLHPRLRREQYAFFRQTHFENPSALMMAVQTGGRMADLMLDYLLLKGHPSPSILADAYIAAAYGGHYAIVLRLDELNSFGKVCNAEGITPLQAAVVGGNATVCRYLLERYSGASSVLVLVAAVLVNIDVLQLLIDYGANPNTRLCTDHIGLYDYLSIPGPRFSGSPLTILTMLLCQVTDHNPIEESVLKMIQNGAVLSYGDVARLSKLCLHTCLKEALSAGGDPNDDDGCGRTALQCAMGGHFSVGIEVQTDSSVLFDEEYQTNGCLSFDNQDKRVVQRLTVKLLIQAGADMTGGEVVRAICLRDEPLLLFLLQHGGTLSDIDDTGRGCLEAEIEARNDPSIQEALEMQEFAIDAGPFCAAIQRKDWALVGRLFERVHQPTTCHLLEGTAVGLAAEAGQLTILEKLLTRFTQHSVLSSAILPIGFERDNIEVHDEYRDRAGFWRTAPDDEGEYFHIEGSLLTLAALGQDTSGFRELLRRGCYMDTIAWSIVAKSERSSDYLHLLREFGTGLGTSTKHDIQLKTALCESIDVGNHDVTQYLVEVGADVNEFDIHAPFFNTANLLSPLQLAAKKGDIEIALYLLEKGAKVNAPPALYQGATALQFASIGGYLGFARHLLQLGARINVRGAPVLGRSALEGAAENGRLDMLALLVHHGAVTTGRGRQQLINSVAYAQGRAHNTAAEWLQETCGWSDADQGLLEHVNVNDEYPLRECLRWYCCDEYHDSDTECVYHYTEEQRSNHYKSCQKCLKLDAESGKGHGIDDGNEGSFSSEDGEMDSESDEN
ncbi:Ankyrin repeat [Fusarium oxysporum f. sp. vasinfectum]|nr:Ankyrin repeat [Fusarium oxysporum f. sp. vasinfectum]